MKIMISAGEVSGDVHASFLVKELKKLRPGLQFFGMGGERLRAEGVAVRFDIRNRGSVGIFEALPNIIPLYFVLKKLIALLKAEKPVLLILVDSQGINLPLAKAAKKLGVKTVYYIPPQEWLWGTPRGLKNAAESVDLIVSIFKKEFDAYSKAGARAVYFGHPLLDIAQPALARVEARKKLVGRDARPIITLCAGSRKHELTNIFPTILEAAKILQRQFPEAFFLIPSASTEFSKKIPSSIGYWELEVGHYALIDGQAYDCLAISDLAICVSGTINLEASILGIPNLMVYRLHPLTYWIGKLIFKVDKKIKYFCMPNILLDRQLVPELIQGQANPKIVAEYAGKILRESPAFDNSELLAILGNPPVLPKIAESVLSMLRH